MVGETKGINHLSSGDPPPIYFTSQQVLVSDWICKPRWYFRRLESVVGGFAQPLEKVKSQTTIILPIRDFSTTSLIRMIVCRVALNSRASPSMPATQGHRLIVRTHSLAFCEDAACRIDIFEALGKTALLRY